MKSLTIIIDRMRAILRNFRSTLAREKKKKEKRFFEEISARESLEKWEGLLVFEIEKKKKKETRKRILESATSINRIVSFLTLTPSLFLAD